MRHDVLEFRRQEGCRPEGPHNRQPVCPCGQPRKGAAGCHPRQRGAHLPGSVGKGRGPSPAVEQVRQSEAGQVEIRCREEVPAFVRGAWSQRMSTSVPWLLPISLYDMPSPTATGKHPGKSGIAAGFSGAVAAPEVAVSLRRSSGGTDNATAVERRRATRVPVRTFLEKFAQCWRHYRVQGLLGCYLTARGSQDQGCFLGPLGALKRAQ
jgi:hypothetical protein